MSHRVSDLDSQDSPNSRSWLVLLLIGSVLAGLGLASDRFFDRVTALTEPPALRQPIDTSGAAAVRAAVEQREAEGAAMRFSPLTPAKGRGLARSLALVLFLNAAVSFAISRRWIKLELFDPFPLVIGTSLVLLMIGYRITIGAGWGGADLQDGQAGTGFLLNYVDNLSYASWAAQARAGRWLFMDLFTTDPHPAIYFNPFYILVGRLSQWLDCRVFLVLNVLGALGAIVCIVALYHITRLIGYSRGAARWTSVFAAFSSGFTAVTTLAHATLDVPLLLGTDAIYIETILSNTFSCWPYQSVAYALYASAVWLALKHETLPHKSTQGRLAFGMLFVLSAALITTHPYEGMLLLGTYGLFLVATWYRHGERLGTRFRTAVLIGMIVVPVTLYNAWVAQQPVWSYFAHVCLSDSRPWWSWLIGYGTLLPLAVIGAIRTLRDPQHEPGTWLALWLLVSATLLIVVNVPQTTRFCNGLHMPICILAAVTWHRGLVWSRSLAARWARALAFLVILIVTPILFATAYSMLLYGYRPHRYDPALEEVATVLRVESPDGFPRVLSDVRSARMLAVLAPARTYAGHYALTPDYAERRKLLTHAGFFESPDHTAPDAVSDVAFRQLLTSANVDFVVTQADTPAQAYAATTPALKQVAAIGVWNIYRLHDDAESAARE